MIITFRASDDLVAEIDRIAAASGMTRSAWISRTLATAALSDENESLPIVEPADRGRPGDSTRVNLRLTRGEVEAIEKVAIPMGLSRNQWLKRTIRWQLWDKAGVLRLAPETKDEIGKIRKQIIKLHNNINQAVKAMHAANMTDSRLEIARIAEAFTQSCDELRDHLFDWRLTVTNLAGGEVGYWVGGYVRERA